MRRFFLEMNPTLRGFLIIAAIAGLILLLSLETALYSLQAILRIAFFLAIAFFIFLLWRERRNEIETWSPRARAVFYGAALLAVADLAVFFWRGAAGLDAVAFLLVLGFAGFAMWRVWRAEHTYF